MSEMSRADAELVYKCLNDSLRDDIVAVAHEAALDEFENIGMLEFANNDSESEFSWENITYEGHRGNLDRDELFPLLGVDSIEEPEVHNLARNFGWLVIENIREEIRNMQDETIFSPREFVTLVVDAEWDEQYASMLMDISVGNFRGKKESVSNKIKTAETTVTRAEQIRGE